MLDAEKITFSLTSMESASESDWSRFPEYRMSHNKDKVGIGTSGVLALPLGTCSKVRI